MEACGCRRTMVAEVAHGANAVVVVRYGA